jgi:hypothetical protein
VAATVAIEIRPAQDADRRPLALLFAAVAEERDGIAAEPPIDVEKRAARWNLDENLVALADGAWRGRGVGTALRHHVKRDGGVHRLGVVYAQEALDVTAAHRGKLAFADLAEVCGRSGTVFRPFVILPGLELLAAGIPLVLAHGCLVPGSGEEQPAPGEPQEARKAA